MLAVLLLAPLALAASPPSLPSAVPVAPSMLVSSPPLAKTSAPVLIKSSIPLTTKPPLPITTKFPQLKSTASPRTKSSQAPRQESIAFSRAKSPKSPNERVTSLLGPKSSPHFKERLFSLLKAKFSQRTKERTLTNPKGKSPLPSKERFSLNSRAKSSPNSKTIYKSTTSLRTKSSPSIINRSTPSPIKSQPRATKSSSPYVSELPVQQSRQKSTLSPGYKPPPLLRNKSPLSQRVKPPPLVQALITGPNVFDGVIGEPDPPPVPQAGNDVTVNNGEFLKNIQAELRRDNDDYHEMRRSLLGNTVAHPWVGRGQGWPRAGPGARRPMDRPTLLPGRPAYRPALAALLPLSREEYLSPVQPTPRSRSHGVQTTRKMQRPVLLKMLTRSSLPSPPSTPSLPPQPPPPLPSVLEIPAPPVAETPSPPAANPPPLHALPPLEPDRPLPAAPDYSLPQTLTTHAHQLSKRKQSKLKKLVKFIRHNKGLLKQLMQSKRQRSGPEAGRGRDRAVWRGAGGQRGPPAMRARVSEVPSGAQLDMAHARGSFVSNMRLKGRLCQRSVMSLEGPKYSASGRAYRPRHPGAGFALTRPPALLLPACCNCCKKSALGCE